MEKKSTHNLTSKKASSGVLRVIGEWEELGMEQEGKLHCPALFSAAGFSREEVSMLNQM